MVVWKSLIPARDGQNQETLRGLPARFIQGAGIGRLIAGLAALITFGAISAASLTTGEKISWAFRYNLTSEAFSNAEDEYRHRNYRMTDVDGYLLGKRVRHAAIWEENRTGRGWAGHHEMTFDGYREKNREYKAQGFLPVDMEAYGEGGQLRWAGIWAENTERLTWYYHRGLDSAGYGKFLQEKNRAGFRLVDMEAYETAAGVRYAAIGYLNTDERPWEHRYDMTGEEYREEVAELRAQGMQVVDIESYPAASGQLYAAIWAPEGERMWRTQTDLTEEQFSDLLRRYRDEGYRPVDFECYRTDKGPRYAGIWIENTF